MDDSRKDPIMCFTCNTFSPKVWQDSESKKLLPLFKRIELLVKHMKIAHKFHIAALKEKNELTAQCYAQSILRDSKRGDTHAASDKRSLVECADSTAAKYLKISKDSGRDSSLADEEYEFIGVAPLLFDWPLS